MEDTKKIQSEQESLKIINQVAGKAEPPQTPKSEADTASVESNLGLDEVALPELTDDFNAKKKTRRSIPFQLVFLGTFIVGFLALVRGCSTMSQPNQAKEGDKAVATTPLEESERQELMAVINDQNLAIQELQQGKRIDIRQGKDGKLPKPPVNSAKVNKLNTPTRKTPPRAAVTTRPIPVRRSPVPHRQSAPKVIYKDRVVYKEAPAKPQPTPVAQSGLKPVSRVSLTQKHEPPATQPTPKPIKIERVPRTPARQSGTVASAPPSQPKLISAESGVLVASSEMTGDLLQDTSNASQPASVGTSAAEGTAPAQTSLVRGSIPAGTTVKAAFARPLAWVAGLDRASVQPVQLRLKEDLGDFAKKGSVAIGEVISVEGDIAQVQIVSINGKPIAPAGSGDPRQVRPNPVAVVQYKNTPYLQAKAKHSGGPNIGDKLLRAGLNVGVDQLRDTGAGVGRSVGSVANSLLPNQQSRFDRGSSIYSFEGKDVEIYFLEGI